MRDQLTSARHGTRTAPRRPHMGSVRVRQLVTITAVSTFFVLLVAGGAASALSITTAAITFPGVALNGTDQTISGTTTAWQVDANGQTGGWNVTVSSGSFTNGGSGTIDVSNFEVRLLDADIVLVSGDPTVPGSTQTTFAALSATPLKIASAASGTGNGVYDLTPGFRLTVPAEVVTGSFSATVTVLVSAGP